MALWKDSGPTPSPTASGTPAAAATPASVTELHGKSERAPVEPTTADSTRQRAPAIRAPGAESVRQN